MPKRSSAVRATTARGKSPNSPSMGASVALVAPREPRGVLVSHGPCLLVNIAQGQLHKCS